MKIRYQDNKGFFDEGYYDATILKIERYKTVYHTRLMFWFGITNKHDRHMKINSLTPYTISADNELGKIYKLIYPESQLSEFESDDLIGKNIGIVLRKKVKKSKTYLNVVNYLPLKKPEKKKAGSPKQDLEELTERLAEVIEANPDIAKLLVAAAHKKKHSRKTASGKREPKTLGEIINEAK